MITKRRVKDRPLGEDASQFANVHPPACAVACTLLVGRESAVAQPQQGARAVLHQSDLDRRRARRHLRIAVPAPRHDEPVRRIDLAILTAGEMLAVDVDPEGTIFARVKLRADAHPLDELGRVGQVGEDGRRTRRYALLDLDDYLFDPRLSSASAANRRRSMLRVHIPRR